MSGSRWTANDVKAVRQKHLKPPNGRVAKIPSPFDPFVLLCQSHGLPRPVQEHRFHPTRKWQFDYAWIDALVAVEREGGIWTRGRHTRGTGYLSDMAKYNAAQLAGWIVLRYSPEQLGMAPTLETLKTILLPTSLASRRRA